MSTPRHPEFASKLRSARLRSGKSQERIAAEVGTSRRHWIRWENGDHIPSPEFLTKIGEAVGQPEEFQPDEAEAALRAFTPSPGVSLLENLFSELARALGKNVADGVPA